MRFVQQAFRKHHRKTQVQSCATPLQPITVPPQPITTEFTRRLAQAQAMVLVIQCQRVEKALIEGPGAAVSVRVVRATGLLAADKGGTSDPFVTVLSKGSKKAKTSVKKKTLEPEWDETLDLTVADLAAPLSLTVMDYDKVCTPTLTLNRALALTLPLSVTLPLTRTRTLTLTLLLTTTRLA